MQPCRKRQTIVKRSEGLTILRCINRKCGFHGQEVDEGICSRCPVPDVDRKPPCSHTRPPASESQGGPSIIPTEDMIRYTDADVREMMKEAGMDVNEINEAMDAVQGDVDYPALSMQLWTYKEAVLRWHKAGRPTRTQEEVDQILEGHCKNQCEWYDPEKGRCKGCGCVVSASSIAIFNKIKMATEQCPKGKW